MISQENLELLRSIVSGPALASLAAAILSLIGTYLPGLNEWFAVKGSIFKQLAMLICVTVVCLLIALVSFTGWIQILPEGVNGGIVLFMAWVGALQTNLAVYRFSPQPNIVVELKSTR